LSHLQNSRITAKIRLYRGFSLGSACGLRFGTPFGFRWRPIGALLPDEAAKIPVAAAFRLGPGPEGGGPERPGKEGAFSALTDHIALLTYELDYITHRRHVRHGRLALGSDAA
jgi:hypothetical protein